MPKQPAYLLIAKAPPYKNAGKVHLAQVFHSGFGNETFTGIVANCGSDVQPKRPFRGTFEQITCKRCRRFAEERRLTLCHYYR